MKTMKTMKTLQWLAPLALLGACTEDTAGITVTGNTGSIAGNVTWLDETPTDVSLQRSAAAQALQLSRANLADLWVVLQDAHLMALDSLHPDADGSFLFDSLAAGHYEIRVSLADTVFGTGSATLEEGVRLTIHIDLTSGGSSTSSSSSILPSSSSSDTGHVAQVQIIWNQGMYTFLKAVTDPVTADSGGAWNSYSDPMLPHTTHITPTDSLIVGDHGNAVVRADITLDTSAGTYATFGFSWKKDASIVDLTSMSGFCFAYSSNVNAFVTFLGEANPTGEESFIMLPADTIDTVATGVGSDTLGCIRFADAVAPSWANDPPALELSAQRGINFVFNHDNIPAGTGTHHIEISHMQFMR